MVYDQNELLPGCDWTEQHSAQGFAKRESTVCFGTLLESGDADVLVDFGPYQAHEGYERVISVPFLCLSGKIMVEGPEELDVDRYFSIPQGHYRLTVGQKAIGEEKQVIVMFWEALAEPFTTSAIIVSDEMLDPPDTLLETAGIAGE